MIGALFLACTAMAGDPPPAKKAAPEESAMAGVEAQVEAAEEALGAIDPDALLKLIQENAPPPPVPAPEPPPAVVTPPPAPASED